MFLCFATFTNACSLAFGDGCNSYSRVVQLSRQNVSPPSVRDALESKNLGKD
jgi:hypothetical protein